jgi:hypothetical protein
MAITAQNLAPLPAGAPTLSPASAGVSGPGDWQEPFVVGTVTFTGDGATTAAVCNWIDGVATLPFTPTCVTVFLTNGGNDTAGILKVEGNATAPPRVSAITTTSFTVNYSTAIANSGTSKLLVIAYK